MPKAYTGFNRIVESNILYLANLAALEEWYRWVRKGFFDAQELGSFLYEGVLEALASARKERLKRLKAMAGKAHGASSDHQGRRAGRHEEGAL